MRLCTQEAFQNHSLHHFLLLRCLLRFSCAQGVCNADASPVTVTVVDSCPSCSSAIPASQFSKLAPTNVGSVAVQLQQVIRQAFPGLYIHPLMVCNCINSTCIMPMLLDFMIICIPLTGASLAMPHVLHVTARLCTDYTVTR